MQAEHTSSSRRRRLVLFCIAVVALLPMGVVVGGGDGYSLAGSTPLAAEEPFPTPEPAAHRSPALGGDAEAVPFVPPGSNPPWIVAAPDFAGRTLHWVSEGYQTGTNPSGDTQEQFVRGEFWIEIAADGAVQRGRELFTDKDGGVQQASLYADGILTTVWGVGTYPGAASSVCTQTGGAAHPRMAHPTYLADAGVLTGEGFIFIGDVALDVPAVVGIDGVEPLVVYPSSTTAPTWQSVDHRTPGLVVYRTLSADPTARIVMSEGRAIREDGTLDSAHASTTSDLYVYDSADVPERVFDAPHMDAAACPMAPSS